MKVTGIETYLCDVYRTNWVFVKVLTDSGLYGVGEATLETRELTVQAAVKELERYLMGRDPHDIEAFWHDAYRDAYWRGGAVLMSALGGVAMALWDIKGQDLGVPIYQLLGGTVRDTIPCYANGWFAPAKRPSEFAEKAKGAVAQGFKGLKWDPFGKAYREISKQELRQALACIQAVVEAVGDGIDILIEGHGRFDILPPCAWGAPWRILTSFGSRSRSHLTTRRGWLRCGAECACRSRQGNDSIAAGSTASSSGWAVLTTSSRTSRTRGGSWK